MQNVLIDPLCYYVREEGGGWTVVFDHGAGLLIHADRYSAVKAARDAAEARWLITGRSACVRIGWPEGESILDQTYGKERLDG